ncbi:MAG: FliM/FliN family flagellar motor switch protein [Desulfobulbaceae bacterium]|nr:FliM/FliN family flagellar motor switch protein [Desulfobulbaceae bacterium]
MEPILSRDEIAELLTAIKDGRVSTDLVGEDQSATGEGITEPVDLLTIYTMSRHGESRLPNLDIILDNFARSVSISMTNLLQRNFTVSRQDMGTTPFQEGIAALNNKGAIAIYSIDPLKNGCLIHIDQALSFTLLEIMLGGSLEKGSPPIERALTTIEINILNNIMGSNSFDLKKSFRPLIELSPNLVKVENNFRMVNIVDTDVEMITARFKVIVGTRAAEMQLLIPYQSLEPIKDKLRDIVSYSTPTVTWADTISKEIEQMSTTVAARSGYVDLTIKEILQLKIGDFIELGYDPEQPLTIMVEGKPKFQAIAGLHKNKKAIHITGGFLKPQGLTNGSDRESKTNGARGRVF